MKIFGRIFLILCCAISFRTSAQTDSTATYPYVLPIWGQKVQERGLADQLQLPFGLNINYVNAYVDLKITDFQLFIDGHDLSGIVNTETLNFQQVSGTTNGVNLRADAWVLPFMNVYGLFSTVKGGTNVSLKPTWKNQLGEIILELPEFSSQVDFDALAYGLGTTLIFGWDNYFSSVDMNYSRTDTDLLKEQIGYLTMSARLGYRFGLSKTNPNIYIAPYLGMMYRDFVGAKGSSGTINMTEVFPDLEDSFNNKANEKIAENQALIDNPGTSIAERIKLQAQNQAIETIQDKINNSGAFSADINYFIQKELIQAITFQFGFNLQINHHWMVRGEYGVADSQRFIMTGLQYRFGVFKKGMKQH